MGDKATPSRPDVADASGAPPSVSVLLPTYQRRELVKPAVASVLMQMYHDFELIVVDDGSTDGTGEALTALDGRLRYRWQPNAGVSAARNAGLGLARGSIVAFLDSDNRWLPDHLAVVTELLDRHPEAVLASTCPGWVVRGNERAPDAQVLDSWQDLWHHAPSAGFISCLAVRREALYTIGGFDERLPTAEDTDLLLRLRCLGPFATIRRRTIVRRATSGSLKDRDRRAGHYLDAYVGNAISLAAAADRLPRPQRSEVSRQARGMIHLSEAMVALERGDRAAVQSQLEDACRMLPLSEVVGAVESRTRFHLPRAHETSERLRALTTLAEVWPDGRADEARFLRATAIGLALRLGRPREAARLLAGWGRGGSVGFLWRAAPVVLHDLQRRWQDRRHRGREVAELDRGETNQPVAT